MQFRIVQLAKHCHISPNEMLGWTPRYLAWFYSVFAQLCDSESEEARRNR